MKNIRHRFTGMRFIAPALAAALAATFAIGGAIGFTSHRRPQSLIPAASASNGMNGMAALAMSFAPIVKNAQPAVVSIASTKVVKISGDVIQQVNRQPVNNVAEFNRAMKQAGDKSAALLVNRNGHTSFVALAAQ